MIKKKLAKMLTTCLMSVFIIGTISLYYAYPVTSTYVEDDVVIIQ